MKSFTLLSLATLLIVACGEAPANVEEASGQAHQSFNEAQDTSPSDEVRQREVAIAANTDQNDGLGIPAAADLTNKPPSAQLSSKMGLDDAHLKASIACIGVNGYYCMARCSSDGKWHAVGTIYTVPYGECAKHGAGWCGYYGASCTGSCWGHP